MFLSVMVAVPAGKCVIKMVLTQQSVIRLGRLGGKISKCKIIALKFGAWYCFKD